MKILIAGATGFVGRHLVAILAADKNNSLYLPVRSIEKAKAFYSQENIQLIEWKNIYDGFAIQVAELDAVVNLLGAGIADKRWSNERKKELYNSRVDGVKNLIKILESKKIKFERFIQLTAIGIYAESSNPINEDGAKANDFLGKLCIDWEQSLIDTCTATSKYCILRAGMILGKDGGAMSRMLPIFKYGLGGKLGAGDQHMSWIHVYDLVSLIKQKIESIENPQIYNAVSPFTVKNSDFTKVLGNILGKSTFFNAPSLLLKLAFGELSELILADHNVRPERLKAEKFIYKYPTLEKALKEVVSVP